MGDLPPGNCGGAHHRAWGSGARRRTAGHRRQRRGDAPGARRLGRATGRHQDRRRQHSRRHDAEVHRHRRAGYPQRAPAVPYTDDAGSAASYVNNAAALWIEKGENITVRNNILHDSGNGLFVSSAEPYISRNILIEGNYIYDNGNDGSLFEHNAYTEALGITYQFNRFGPLRGTAGGNNLKDRSAGLVVRYNWIEGGNRQLDLVETDSVTIETDPSYRTTFVYGNVLIEPNAAGNRQIVHYGGDNGGTSNYRKGTLLFYQNTLVSTRD